MSDAREIVQPRWKRRATEIAEAIGGNSSGVSSVSLDSNTITQLSQAIADAIDLKVLDINIKAYDDDLVSSAGLPIRTGTGPVTGGFLPLRVVTDIGDKVDINVREYNDVSVDSRGLPVQAGRTISTNALVPLVVNCPTVNNFPTGGSGGTTTFPSTMDVNIVKFGGGPNISASAHLPITGSVNCSQDTGSLRPWIVSTGVQGSNTLGQWGNTTLSVTETNPVSGSALTGTVDVNIKEYDGTAVNTTGLPFKQGWAPGTNSREIIMVAEQNIVSVDLASGLGSTGLTAIPVTVSGTVATTETSPVTTVSVQPALDTNNVAIPLAVTETNPVSGGGGGGGGLNITDTTTAFKNALYGVGATANTTVHEQVETAMDSALANATGVSCKIIGDETYGIIMTKKAQTTASMLDQYASVGFGTAGRAPQPDQLLSNGDNLNTGWIIRCNGQDIYNQDITLGIVDYAGTPGIYNLNLIEIPFTTSVVNGQETVDKYHGRKVTLSSVANVWIVEPFQNTLQTGYIIYGDGSVPNGWTILTQAGEQVKLQQIWDDGYTRPANYSPNHTKYLGAQVVLSQEPYNGLPLWFVQYLDTT